MAGFKVTNLVKEVATTQISNSEHAILANSPSIQFITPMASNLYITLPAANSIDPGIEYNIYNMSSEYPLMVKDSSGVTTFATIDVNSSISLTSTGSTFVEGPKGPKGDTGAQGEVGPQGPAGTSGGTGDTASKAGVVNISQNASKVDVTFDEPFDNEATYVVVCSVSNTVDSTPNLIAAMITNKTSSGFRAELSANTSSANYKLEWMAR